MCSSPLLQSFLGNRSGDHRTLLNSNLPPTLQLCSMKQERIPPSSDQPLQQSLLHPRVSLLRSIPHPKQLFEYLLQSTALELLSSTQKHYRETLCNPFSLRCWKSPWGHGPPCMIA